MQLFALQDFNHLDNLWIIVIFFFVVVFISCLDSHSDGTHSLQRIYWWASDVMQNLSKSVPVKKKKNVLDGLSLSTCSSNIGWIIPSN